MERKEVTLILITIALLIVIFEVAREKFKNKNK